MNCKGFRTDMMKREHFASTGVIHSWKKHGFSCEKELINIHQLNACLYFSFYRHKKNGRPLYAKLGSVKTMKNLLTPTDYFFGKITFWTSLAFAMFSLFCCNIFSIAWRPLLIVSAFLFSTYWGEFCKISELTWQSKEKTMGERLQRSACFCAPPYQKYSNSFCFSWQVS